MLGGVISIYGDHTDDFLRTRNLTVFASTSVSVLKGVIAAFCVLPEIITLGRIPKTSDFLLKSWDLYLHCYYFFAWNLLMFAHYGLNAELTFLTWLDSELVLI